MFYTTLNKIRRKAPCGNLWTTLLKHLGKEQADDEPISLLTILNSNGLDDALWCLCAVDNCEKEARLYTVWCARQVQHLLTDERSINALDVAERFTNDQATKGELNAAWDAAHDANRIVSGDAFNASVAASYAAYGSANSAAFDAARTVNKDGWDAPREAQKAKFIELFCHLPNTKEQ